MNTLRHALADGARLLALSAAVALLMSTQLLAQPFVWRNWSVGDIGYGWGLLFGERLAVALAIGLSLWLTRAWGRPLRMVPAIIVGALCGELILQLSGWLGAAQSPADLAGRVLRWTLVAAVAAAIVQLGRQIEAAAGAASRATLQRLEAEREITEARLQLLQSQIEPHFLFNTLATVRRLQIVEPDAGARLLANFIAYLRLALPALRRQRAALREELGLARAYLGVIEVRMAGRLTVGIEIEEELLGLAIPSLALLTLVENAVRHGVEPSVEAAEIRLTACRRGALLELAVADTGVGLQGNGGGTGMGLANIRSRLRSLYGERARLLLAPNRPRGLRATLVLPAEPA